MVKDYHMHPQVVGVNNFHDFAETAIARGIEEICVTDHMPLSFSPGGDRIPEGMVEEYCRKVRNLAREYEGRLSVKLGIEVDYYPEYEDEIKAVLKAGEYDYVLGSSHMHISPGIFDRCKTYTEFATAALENTLLAAQSGYFTTIPHMDMYRWIFVNPHRFPLEPDGYTYERSMPLIERILDTIRDEGMFLEINSHFAESQKNIDQTYPQAEILQMALDKGLHFTFGSDAHASKSIGAYLDELRRHPLYGQAIREFESRA